MSVLKKYLRRTKEIRGEENKTAAELSRRPAKGQWQTSRLAVPARVLTVTKVMKTQGIHKIYANNDRKRLYRKVSDIEKQIRGTEGKSDGRRWLTVCMRTQ